MTDREILDEVYSKLKSAPSLTGGDIVKFIEQEWQKDDDKEVRKIYAEHKMALGDKLMAEGSDTGELKEWREELFAKSDDGQTYNKDMTLEEKKEKFAPQCQKFIKARTQTPEEPKDLI